MKTERAMFEHLASTVSNKDAHDGSESRVQFTLSFSLSSTFTSNMYVCAETYNTIVGKRGSPLFLVSFCVYL